MDPLYVMPVIVLILEIALVIWIVRKLTRWIRRVVDKQQEISMIKAQAMKTAAENAQKKDDTST